MEKAAKLCSNGRPPLARDILLAIYESHRTESQQHRQTLLNTFALAVTGIIVLLAGIINAQRLNLRVKWIIAIGVFQILLFVSIHIRRERAASEAAMDILRKVEFHLKMNKILPEYFAYPPRLYLGFNLDDWLLFGFLLWTSGILWLALYFAPS